MVHLVKRTVRTAGQGDTHDLTPQVNETIGASGMKSGAATISVIGSTASVTTIECEPSAVADLGRALEQIAPATAATIITCSGATTTARATYARR